MFLILLGIQQVVTWKSRWRWTDCGGGFVYWFAGDRWKLVKWFVKENIDISIFYQCHVTKYSKNKKSLSWLVCGFFWVLDWACAVSANSFSGSKLSHDERKVLLRMTRVIFTQNLQMAVLSSWHGRSVNIWPFKLMFIKLTVSKVLGLFFANNRKLARRSYS